MKLYRNLKIRTKYFIPVLITVLGFLVVVNYGIKTLQANSNNFISFIDKDQTLLLSLNNMYAQGLQSEQATRNVLLSPNDQKAKDNYDMANDDFAKQLELAKKSTNGTTYTIDKLNQLEQMWQDVDVLKKKVLYLATTGKSEDGISELTNIETPKWREFKKKLLDFISKKQENISLKKSEVLKSVNDAFVKMLSFSIVIVIFSFTIIFVASKSFVKPIRLLETSAKKVALGDTNVSLEIKSNDELGSLAKSFNIMVENIRNSLNEVKHKGMIAEATAKEAEEAKNISNMQKEYLNISVKKILVEMENFANGDLNTYLEVEKDDDIGKLYTGFNKAVQNIKMMIFNVSEAVAATASASTQISNSTEEMAAGAQEQSSQATEVAAAVEQMTKTILETTKNASVTAENAKASGALAREGGNVVKETIEGMNKIADVVTDAAGTVQELGKSSEKIGEIVQVIDDIADQTNLLALNAAIEAARAGEQGRGFAVVADQVRKLAERTTKATKEIASMIRQIQKETTGAVQSMEKGTVEVNKGKKLAEKAGDALNQIITSSQEVVDNVSQVAAASEEQSATSEQISKNIEAISSVIQQSSAGTQQIARAAEDLNRLTDQLQQLIDRFKLDNNVKQTNNEKHISGYAVRKNGKLIEA
ncbi:MAG: methyl-accepting chemotaxis protein [Ignavibacteriaceae bacterium]